MGFSTLFWALMGSSGLDFTGLPCFWLYWTVVDSAVLDLAVLGSAGLDWAVIDSSGQYYTGLG